MSDFTFRFQNPLEILICVTNHADSNLENRVCTSGNISGYNLYRTYKKHFSLFTRTTGVLFEGSVTPATKMFCTSSTMLAVIVLFQQVYVKHFLLIMNLDLIVARRNYFWEKEGFL